MPCMKYALLALILGIVCYPVNTESSQMPRANPKDNPIFKQIVKNHPSINKEYALELAFIIQKMSRLYNVQDRKLAAILAQESMYTLNTKRCTKAKCTDFGISQIHYKTVAAYKFDKQRLLTDLEYSIEAGAVVLSDIKRMYGEKEPNWWSRYNASNPEKRKLYEKLVKKYL